MLSKVNIYNFVFLLLLSLILLNINGIVFLFSGRTSLLSPLILVCCIYLIINSDFYTNNLLRTYYFFYICYICIGVFALFVTRIIGDDVLKTIFDIVKTIIITTGIFIGFNENSKSHKENLNIICLLTILSVLLGFVIHLFDIDVVKSNYRTLQRLSGNFVNPNEMAAQSLFAIIAIQYFFSKLNLKLVYKLILLFCLGVSLYCLFMSFSRGILIASAVILVFDLLFFSKLSVKKIGNYFLLVLLSIFILNQVSQSIDSGFQRRIERTLSIFNDGITDENSGHRVQLFNNAMDLIYESPFIGTGIGNLQKMGYLNSGAHNAYITVFGNSGFFVLLILLFFLVKLISTQYNFYKKHDVKFIFYVLLIIYIHGFFKTGVLEFKINNLFLAMAMAMTNYSKKPFKRLL